MSDLANALEAELDHTWPGIARERSPGSYASILLDAPHGASYRALPHELLEWTQRIEALPDGGMAIEQYHRCVLAHLLSAARERGSVERLPASIRPLVAAEHARIEQELRIARRDYYLRSNDPFAKDLAIAALRLIPCGAEHVELVSGIPRSLAWRDGVGQALSVLSTGIAAGGFHPWFESHWDRRRLKDFTASGYDAFYLRVVDLLETRPDAKGLIGSSWWFDPAVAELSPELAYLSSRPLENGARRFRVGRSDVATTDALRFSRARSGAHKEGRYQPCVYMIAWGREAMRRWAARVRAANLSS